MVSRGPTDRAAPLPKRPRCTHRPEKKRRSGVRGGTAGHRRSAAARRAEVAWTGIVCAMILAFMPLVPRAGALSLDASPSRLMELGLLALALVAAFILAPPARLIEIASRNAGLSIVVGSFAIWAALTTVFAGKSPTGI